MIRVKRYPFTSREGPAYETCFEAFDMLLDRVATVDEIVKKKLLEIPDVAKVITFVDLVNSKDWAEASVELSDVEIWLSKDEWIKLVTETINTLKARISILEEHLKNLEKRR
jgi:hypothetical protein